MFSQRARARASLCRLDRMLIEEPKGHPSYQARVAVSKLISRVATAWTDRYRHSQSSSASRRRAAARSGSPPQQRIECSPRSTRRCRSASPAAGRNRSGWPQRRPTPVRGASRWRDNSRQGSAARTRGRRGVRIRSGGGAPPRARQNQPQLSAVRLALVERSSRADVADSARIAEEPFGTAEDSYLWWPRSVAAPGCRVLGSLNREDRNVGGWSRRRLLRGANGLSRVGRVLPVAGGECPPHAGRGPARA